MWQKYKGKSDAIKGSSVRIRYSKILHISAPSDVHAEDNKSQTTPSIMGRFRQHHQGSFVSDTQSIPQSATVGTSYPHCTVAVGVLGLRAASDHCFAAYITSLLSSHELKLAILIRMRRSVRQLSLARSWRGCKARQGGNNTNRGKPSDRPEELPELVSQHHKL